MTRRKQSWGEQRGWIVPADGSPPQQLPAHMVGHKLISWPGTMREKQPAEPMKYLGSANGRAPLTSSSHRRGQLLAG